MSEVIGTKNFSINAAFFQEIKDDHLQLEEILASLRRLVAQRPALPNHACELDSELQRLCDQLALHFSLEEAYGYFEDIVESTPHLYSQTGRLREQHPKLFVMARDLADKAAERHKGVKAELWEIADAFAEFDNALRTHEAAELQLIMKAMNQDEGGGD